jgi:hypothetical protein
MVPIVKKFLVASLFYLGIGLLAQAVTMFDAWFGFNPLAYTASAATGQILLLGWLTQLGLALAYDRWILPALGQMQPPTRTLHPPKSVTIVFVLFNLGLPLMILGQPGLILFGGVWLGIVAALGGILLLLAGLGFIGLAWRVLRT